MFKGLISSALAAAAGCCLGVAAATAGDPRVASPAGTLDAGGGLQAEARYGNWGSLGGVAGVSSALERGWKIESGYPAQIDWAGPWLTPDGDLAVQLAAAPASLAVGGYLSVAVTVENRGSTPVPQVALTVTLPRNARIVSASLSQGSWRPAGEALLGSLGWLPPQAQAQFNLLLLATAAGPLAGAATVGSALPDPAPDNNQSAFSTVVTETPAVATRVRATCRSIQMWPVAGLIQGAWNTNLVTTFDGLPSQPDARLPSQESRPRAGAPGVYEADFLTYNSSGILWQYGSIVTILPATDADQNTLPDVFQWDMSGEAAVSGLSSADWPSIPVSTVQGTISRQAGSLLGSYALTLKNEAGQVSYDGIYSLACFEFQASYRHGANHTLHLDQLLRASDLFTNLAGGEASFTVVSSNQIQLAAFRLTNRVGAVYQTRPATLIRSGNVFRGEVLLADGYLPTPWPDYTQWVWEVTDLRDDDHNGIPDLSEAPSSAPVVDFASGQYLVPENGGEAQIQVVLNHAASLPVSVDYSTRPGTALPAWHYLPVAGTLRFAPGEVSQTVRVPILNDSRHNPDRSLLLELSAAQNAAVLAPGQAVVVIVDDDPLPVDNDGDGMPDDWERLYGFNPNDPADAALDADHDGLTNLQEYLAGTHPLDPLSRLQLAISLTNHQCTIAFDSASQRAYLLEWSASVGAPAWEPLLSRILGDGTRLQFSDPSNVQLQRSGFYRLRLLPD